jgi:hypothetical protein
LIYDEFSYLGSEGDQDSHVAMAALAHLFGLMAREVEEDAVHDVEWRHVIEYSLQPLCVQRGWEGMVGERRRRLSRALTKPPKKTNQNYIKSTFSPSRQHVPTFLGRQL